MYGRRAVLKGAASLPLAAILADPTLARAAADGLETVDLTTAEGRSVSGAVARPETSPSSAVLLVHEWWGLNDQIKAVAADFATQGYLAVAVDLYQGNVATERQDARKYMQSVVPAEAVDTLTSWIDWAKADGSASGKVGTVGWCFGGGWSLNASLAAPVDATIVYYGNVAKSAVQLAPLAGPVLGHFATRDGWIDKAMVDGFTAAMAEAGKDLQAHWYEADHGFANPTSARYDQADAELAWTRTVEFFEANL